MRRVLLVCVLVFPRFTPAADATFTGYARSLATHELLYVESHSVRDAGTAAETRVVLYRCARGGAPFARKELSYAADRSAPSFDFEDARSGVAEGLVRDARSLTVFERASSNAERRSGTLDASMPLVADAGFDEFVRSHWAALERGEDAVVRFLVPSRLDSVKFRVRKVDAARVGGEAASVIRLSLAGPLGWFVPDIDVTYRNRDRLLLRYRGITNLRDASGAMISAQIDFPDEGRGNAAVDLEALRSLPLTRTCEP